MNTPTHLNAFLEKSLTSELADLSKVLTDVVSASMEIAESIEKGAILGNMHELHTENIQGETQKTLDVIANDIFVAHCQRSGLVAGMVSEEVKGVIEIPQIDGVEPRYLVLFDPLDGSSNVNLNGTVGTIFSILTTETVDPEEADFLQAGTEQVCAGYVLYGTSTMLVLTTGDGVNGFTLDALSGEYVLTHPDMQIPKESNEFAVNMSNYRFWQAPVQNYIDDCLQGEEGMAEKDYNMRWVGAMVAEVHRILVRGGVFMYPIDSITKKQGGKLRLMYEVNPMSFIVEQAGGLATTGFKPVMKVQPKWLHERVPVMLGSDEEISKLIVFHKGKK